MKWSLDSFSSLVFLLFFTFFHFSSLLYVCDCFDYQRYHKIEHNKWTAMKCNKYWLENMHVMKNCTMYMLVLHNFFSHFTKDTFDVMHKMVKSEYLKNSYKSREADVVWSCALWFGLHFIKCWPLAFAILLACCVQNWSSILSEPKNQKTKNMCFSHKTQTQRKCVRAESEI